ACGRAVSRRLSAVWGRGSVEPSETLEGTRAPLCLRQLPPGRAALAEALLRELHAIASRPHGLLVGGGAHGCASTPEVRSQARCDLGVERGILGAPAAAVHDDPVPVSCAGGARRVAAQRRSMGMWRSLAVAGPTPMRTVSTPSS